MWLALSFIVVTSVHASQFSAGDAARGQELHQANCTRCHDAAIYTRPDRIVHSYAQLRDRIQLCELSAELGWFEEEVEDVAVFLNSTYYKFEAE